MIVHILIALLFGEALSVAFELSKPTTCGSSGFEDTGNPIFGSQYGYCGPEALLTFSLDSTTEVKFGTCGSDMETIIGVYNDALTSRYCESTGGCPRSTKTLLICMLPKGSYTFMIEGKNCTSGRFDYNIECTPQMVPTSHAVAVPLEMRVPKPVATPDFPGAPKAPSPFPAPVASIVPIAAPSPSAAPQAVPKSQPVAGPKPAPSPIFQGSVIAVAAPEEGGMSLGATLLLIFGLLAALIIGCCIAVHCCGKNRRPKTVYAPPPRAVSVVRSPLHFMPVIPVAYSFSRTVVHSERSDIEDYDYYDEEMQTATSTANRTDDRV
jgi:hypothetical protein